MQECKLGVWVNFLFQGFILGQPLIFISQLSLVGVLIHHFWGLLNDALTWNRLQQQQSDC